MQQIADWLKKLGMAEYVERFTENDIDMAVLPDLTDQHLKELGVSLGASVENAAGDPRFQWRFGCRNGTLGTRGGRTTSAR